LTGLPRFGFSILGLSEILDHQSPSKTKKQAEETDTYLHNSLKAQEFTDFLYVSKSAKIQCSNLILAQCPTAMKPFFCGPLHGIAHGKHTLLDVF
jgi:hypothetical protein